MIDFTQALQWLNKYDRSSLSSSSQELASRLAESKLAGKAFDDQVKATLTVVKTWEYPLEEAEIHVICAEALWQRGHFELARDLLKKAIDIYGSKREAVYLHRAAVTLWLCGHVQWAQNHNYAACDDWNKACDLFTALAMDFSDRSAVGKKDERVIWYKGVIQGMKTALAGTAEEVYTWLNNPEPGFLSLELAHLREHLVEVVKKGDYIQSNQLVRRMMKLASVCSNLAEKAETFLECGLALYHSRDYPNAIQMLHMAVATYHPGCSQRPAARWILGIVQRKDQVLQEEGIRNWQISIEEYEALLDKAKKARNEKQIGLYQERIKRMSGVREEAMGQVG